MFVWLLRIVLIWWLATVVVRWISGSKERGNSTDPRRKTGRGEDNPLPNEPPDIPARGSIEDADFEDMSEK